MYTTYPRCFDKSDDYEAQKTAASNNAQAVGLPVCVLEYFYMGPYKSVTLRAVAHANGTIDEY